MSSIPKPHIKPKADPCRPGCEPPARDAPGFPERDAPVFSERDPAVDEEADEGVIFREDGCLG